MNAWKRALHKIRWAARVIFHDLFGEGDLKESELFVPGGLPASAFLDPIQAQLDALAAETAHLEERLKQTEVERAIAAAEVRTLENAVDQALLSGADEKAHRLGLSKLMKSRQLADLDLRLQEQTQITADTRRVMDRIRKRIDQSRRQIADLSSHEQDAVTLENLAAARHEIDRSLASLEEELTRRNTHP